MCWFKQMNLMFRLKAIQVLCKCQLIIQFLQLIRQVVFGTGEPNNMYKLIYLLYAYLYMILYYILINLQFM